MVTAVAVVAVVVVSTPGPRLSPRVAAASPVASNAQLPVVVACGIPITTSVTLTVDLACTGHGLVIGADNITVNLGGHTVSGDRTTRDYGVFNNGHTGVIVQNGRIRDFQYGVVLTNTDGPNRIQSLRVSASLGAGIDVNYASNSVVTLNTVFSNQRFGIVVGNGDKNQITGNTVASNRLAGIEISSGTGNVVSANKTLSNVSHGIAVESAAEATQISNNLSNGNGGHGLLVNAAEPAGATVTSNTGNYNTRLGIFVAPGLTDGGGNKAHGNGELHQCANLVCP